MKNQEQMNWTKRQTQLYGRILALLGFILGVLITMLLMI